MVDTNLPPISSDDLFTDEQMREFLTNGFVIIKPDLPKSIHDTIYQKLDEVVDMDGNPGNNLLPRVPEIQDVFNHPTVRGAFTSVIGPNYMMHPHRHPHTNRSGSSGGGWHKDSYWGYGKVRNHRTWWAMVFYYPQDTPVEIGPTAVMPGSPYYLSRQQDSSETKFSAVGEAGTMAIIHYDLWHQATANQTDLTRYMLKFEFIRMKPPTIPTWNNQDTDWCPPSDSQLLNDQSIMWQHLWNWSSGRSEDKTVASATEVEIRQWITALRIGTQPERMEAANHLGTLGRNGSEAITTLIQSLNDPSEPVGLNAAYALGAIGEESIEPLTNALQDENETIRRHAAYALTAVGSGVEERVTELLNHKSADTRGYAAYVLGEIDAVDSVPNLVSLLDDESVNIRRNVVEALGLIQGNTDTSVRALAKALVKDEDKQTRFTAALSLARIGPAAEEAVPALKDALKDNDRYVRGYGVEALKYIGTPEAKSVLIDHLMTMRWCTSTNKASTF